MKLCTVPAAFRLDLGYRKLVIEAGQKAYPDEVAHADRMLPYWDAGQEDAPADGDGATTKPGEDLPPLGRPPAKPAR